MTSQHEQPHGSGESSREYEINSLRKLAHYLGAVALGVPGALADILWRR